jgi:hypothetical protein
VCVCVLRCDVTDTSAARHPTFLVDVHITCWYVPNTVIQGISKHRQLKKKSAATANKMGFKNITTAGFFVLPRYRLQDRDPYSKP